MTCAGKVNIMNFLTYTKLTPVPSNRPTKDRVKSRRQNLTTRIDQQIELATFDMDGKPVPSAAVQQIKKWYWPVESGELYFELRYGSGIIKMDPKGKDHAFKVADLPALIGKLKKTQEAVNLGYLDTEIEAASESLRSKKSKA